MIHLSDVDHTLNICWIFLQLLTWLDNLKCSLELVQLQLTIYMEVVPLQTNTDQDTDNVMNEIESIR